MTTRRIKQFLRGRREPIGLARGHYKFRIWVVVHRARRPKVSDEQRRDARSVSDGCRPRMTFGSDFAEKTAEQATGGLARDAARGRAVRRHEMG
jgi:hypothetical protein